MFKKILPVVLLLILAISVFASCGKEEEDSSASIVENGLVFAPYSYERNEYKIVKVLDDRTELVIPSEVQGKKVVAIAHSAFYNNQNIKKVVIPNSVVLIEDYAFDDCRNLEEVSFSLNITEIGFSAFSDCKSLKELILPKRLERLEPSAFAGCDSLEALHVSMTLKEIGRDAFRECPSLSDVYVYDLSSFCSIKFENIDANPITKAEKLFLNGAVTDELVIENVESVSPYAFYGFTGIKSLTLGEGVINVGESAFSNCKSLKTLAVSDSVKKIGTSAFNSCTSLERVSFEGGVEYFAGLAFYNCTAIKTLNIDDVAAWCRAFFYTDSTGSANPMLYAKRLTVMGVEANELVIPHGVDKITTLAFIGFKGVKVTLPSSLKIIEDTAFYMCDKLEALHFNGGEAELMLLLSSIGSNNFEKITQISYNK